jgi:hypothetical protein
MWPPTASVKRTKERIARGIARRLVQQERQASVLDGLARADREPLDRVVVSSGQRLGMD